MKVNTQISYMATSKDEPDPILTAVLAKIDSGTVTCEDFNGLITKTMIGETSPESVRDRMRRRTKRNETDSHIEADTGHQPLHLPKMAGRVQPKIAPVHQQNHGRSRIAHTHSAKTQSHQHPHLATTLEFIKSNYNKSITEATVAAVPARDLFKKLLPKLMARPNVNRDWFQELLQKLDKA